MSLLAHAKNTASKKTRSSFPVSQCCETHTFHVVWRRYCFFQIILNMADANQPRPNMGREPSLERQWSTHIFTRHVINWNDETPIKARTVASQEKVRNKEQYVSRLQDPKTAHLDVSDMWHVKLIFKCHAIVTVPPCCTSESEGDFFRGRLRWQRCLALSS